MKHTKLWIGILDAVLVLGALLAVPMAKVMMAVIPNCPYAEQGITCLSCGATRCVRSFFSLQFGQAFAYHPAIFLAIVYLGLGVLALNGGYLLDLPWCKKITHFLFNPWCLGGMALFYVVFGVIRMILLFPT